MRAATVIVGAIAAASILIALAFILSPGGGSSTPGTTTVVRKTVEAPPKERSATTENEETPPQLGGPDKCGTQFSVENASCEVGEAVHAEYDGGTRGLLIVKDPESGEYLEFNCGEPTPVICKEIEGSGTVSFGA